MKVRATRLGYYNHKRQREGAIFDLVPIKKRAEDGKGFVIIPAEAQFSEKWMEKVDLEVAGDQPKGKGKAKSAARAESPPDDVI
jgi:hypothetical protein